VTDGVEDIQFATSSLSRITRQLSLLGQVTLLATAAHLVVLVLQLLRLVDWHIGVQISVALLGVSVASALYFETIKKRGDVLFDELSNEFQWHLARVQRLSASEPSAAERPNLGYRIQLRSFLRVADLPLAPGKHGPLVYVMLNVLFLFGVASGFGVLR
jgi:hypothetical protein